MHVSPVTHLATWVQVRYESRRRLAEQRPRHRGQFVKASAATQASDMAEASTAATTLVARPTVQA